MVVLRREMKCANDDFVFGRGIKISIGAFGMNEFSRTGGVLMHVKSTRGEMFVTYIHKRTFQTYDNMS